MTFGSLFSGCGAFDLGLERAGLRCLWQVENNRQARKILDRHFPGTAKHGDIRGVDPADLDPVDLICGGDPCPYRSRANRVHGTDSPDLYPEFLRIVRALRPLWVLRENVVASDADECCGQLEDLGYDALVVEADSAEVTGQSRPREYLCGVLASSGICVARVLSQPEGRRGNPQAIGKAGQVARCLTTETRRYDSRDNYILEPGRGVRILDSVERERLQALPDDWTGGLPAKTRGRLTGNAVTAAIPEWISRRIMETATR